MAVSTPRVFADTNTLFPFYVCGLLLHCAEEGLFTVLWTEDLLDELVGVIPRSGRKKRAAVESMCQAIREAFPDAEVPRAAYPDLIDQMPGPDPDDHVHSAAAIGGGATVLLTRDRRGFPARPLAARGVRVTNADQFLCELFATFPDDLVRVLDLQVADLTRSHLKRAELLTALAHDTSVPRFAARVSRWLALSDS